MMLFILLLFKFRKSEKKNIGFAKSELNFQLNPACISLILFLINDSILTYRLDEKYLTEVKSNQKPVKRIFYYDRDYRIDSVIWIIAKDTMVYK